MIIDTETIGIDKPFVYDIGIVVAELDGTQYKAISKDSFIIKQIYDNRILFETAYYAEKRPLYTRKMKGRKTIRKYWGHVARYIDRLAKIHGIKEIYAYNVDFDKRALETTSRILKTYQPLKHSTYKDIMAIASAYIHNTKDYQDYCRDNRALTPKGYIQTNAERTYQYLTQNKEFIEEHTGLSDALIELEILNDCILKGYDNKKEYRKKFIRA